MEKQVLLENSKKQKLSGVLHIPKTIKRAPAIICCHGFSGNKVDKYRMWVRLARKLCDNGFVVLRFDFSGHGDSEGEMDEVSISQELDDVKCAIEFLRAHETVASGKLGIIGHSLGGEIAILEAAQDPMIGPIVLLAPVVDYKEIGGDFPKALECSQKTGFGELAGHMINKKYFDEMIEFRPLEMAGKITAPTLIIHGADDDTVDVGGSIEYMKRANEPKTLCIIDGTDHSFCGYNNIIRVFDETVKWFTEHCDEDK